MDILIPFLLIFLLSLIQGDDQARRIKEGEWINHKQESLWVAVLTGICMLFYIPFPELNTIDVIIYLLTISSYVCHLLSFRWIVFDIILNLFRGLSITYIGIKDKDDAKSDNFLLSLPYPEYTQYVVKFGLLFLSLLIYKML